MKINHINSFICNIISESNISDLVYFKNENLPFFKYTKYKFFSPSLSIHNHSQRFFIFLFGIKSINSYHLNIVTFDKYKNHIDRFEPRGGINTNIDNATIARGVAKALGLGTTPTLHINEGAFQAKSDKNCVPCCMEYIRSLIEKIREN